MLCVPAFFQMIAPYVYQVRVREHAESIAFYSGDGNEKDISVNNFSEVIVTRLQKIKWLAGTYVLINPQKMAEKGVLKLLKG